VPIFFTIFTDIVLPVLLLVGLGALLQKCKPLDINTLSKVTVWLLVPSFLFVKVYESNLTWTQIGGITVALVGPMLAVALVMYALLRRLTLPGGPAAMSAMVMSAVVVNAGNFGIPVAELTYGDRPQGPVLHFAGMTARDGIAVQALCVLISNLTLWGFGYIAMTLARGDGWRGALAYFRLPMIYAIVLAFLLRDTHTPLPRLLKFPLDLLTAATVPIMLITLGAQLARSARWPRWGVVLPVAAIKLALMPLITWPLAVTLGMWPWPGAQLVISAAGPAAVNVLFITLELGGDAELAADCVFWSTVICAVTVTAVIAVVAAA
jgi:predicted permease